MILIVDAEWYSPEEEDVVHGAKYLHCIVAKELGKENWFEFSSAKGLAMPLEEFPIALFDCNALIGHNIVNADLHVFKKLLGVEFTVSPRMTLMDRACKFIDTYSMSMRLFPDRPDAYYKGKSMGAHGLAAWGVRNRVYKPEIQDWKNLPPEEYLHRCKEDVKNNEATYYRLLEEMKK